MADSKMITDVEISLSKGDIEALKCIHNAAAGKGNHLRRAKDPLKVYAAAVRVDAVAVEQYITERETPEAPPAKKAKVVREYGGRQPKQQDDARLYLKGLFDTGQIDELWTIWRQLCTDEQRSTSRWPSPCAEHAEEVYFAAKDMTNGGATFATAPASGQTTLDTVLPDHMARATALENAPEPAPAPVMVQTTLTVAPKVFKTQAPMFKHSDAHDHKAHMAIQNTYEKDGATKMAFKYASFPTLDAMVSCGEHFPDDKPQCLFEMAREGAIVAPYMDVDCTLDAPAPHLLVLIVAELIVFTQTHLGRTPRVVCTDSSRDKGGGRYKNSWHIILHDIGGFRNGASATSKGGDMRLYFEAFFASLQAPELTALDSETWDVSVYSKNSNMRCVGSHKADDESRTRLEPHDQYQGASMSDYYVQQPGLDAIVLPASMIPTAPEHKASVPRAHTGTTTPVDIPDDLHTYLEGQGMTIRSALTENGCKIVKVNCKCPFAGREHKNNGQYVTVTGGRAYLKCFDDKCSGQRKLLDWQPAPTALFHGLPAAAPVSTDEPTPDAMALDDSAQPPDNGGPPEPAVASAEDQISDLLAWKLSHPSYGVHQLRVDAGDVLSTPLQFCELTMSSDKTPNDTATLTATVQMCPNVGAVYQPRDQRGNASGPKITCDGRPRISLYKEFPHQFALSCPCCRSGGPRIDGVGGHGFHRDDTAVHELIWEDYNQCRGGLNHIALFENDEKPAKIPHGTRCKMYITNALNDYALRMGYHKRGAVVQVRSKTCPIAFETVRVGNEDMSFTLFIEQAERALPRLKETMKTSDYKRWAEWCATTNHSEFPVLKPDRHLLAFSNVAVDITGGHMAVKIFGQVAGAVARAYNDIEFKPEYADMPFDELLALCPLFRKYIEAHFPADLVEHFNFKHRQGTQDWWIGKIFMGVLARLLFEVNELDRWRVMLYILGPKNCGKSELWKAIVQKFFDVSAVYTYEREPDKFSVQAMVGKAPPVRSARLPARSR